LLVDLAIQAPNGQLILMEVKLPSRDSSLSFGDYLSLAALRDTVSLSPLRVLSIEATDTAHRSLDSLQHKVIAASSKQPPIVAVLTVGGVEEGVKRAFEHAGMPLIILPKSATPAEAKQQLQLALQTWAADPH
jgi:hypothetical protein